MKESRVSTPPPPVQRLILPFQQFLRTEASGGILLLVATALALLWANSPWSASYTGLWHTTLTVGVDGFALSKPLELWINDGLMAIFFFVVGLEIKRELLVGELASPRQAALPIAAAVGGMVVPALVYIALNPAGEAARGWAIPMATDIAFALGVLALLGDRIPSPLKIFLVALAIVDDLGAVLVIAVFYTAEISVGALTVAGLVLTLMLLANLLDVRRPLVYGTLGLILWLAVLKSGVHATIAGVLAAATIPARVRLREGEFSDTVRATLAEFEAATRAGPTGHDRRQAALQAMETACEHVETPLARMEHALLPWVAFVVMPIFALANAGVELGGALVSALTSPVGLGIALGLVLGKMVGITGASWLAVRLGIAGLAAGVDWRQLNGVSWLAGIGFTMSLFIANLAFPTGPLLPTAKLGILSGSLLAGIVGWSLLRLGARTVVPNMEEAR